MSRFIQNAILGLLLCSSAASCRSEDPFYSRVLTINAASEKTLTRPGLPAEFATLFPSTEHAVLNVGTTVNGWISETSLFGRYRLEMRIDGHVDESGYFQAASPAKFAIIEVTNIALSPQGGHGITFDGTNFDFGEAEWARLRESGGDFDSIGIPLKKESPVAGFAEAYPKG